ncbi:MAG: cell division protein FtsQ/DivIB [Weeksellaceae bacterium]
MKKKWILLKVGLFLITLIFLLSFSKNRYKLREVIKVDTKIDYKDGNHFVTSHLVDSLLKKSHPDYPHMAMQKVNQQKMEKLLRDNEFITDANVYLENNGILYTEIAQEVPLARVKDINKEYYITEKGKSINLSPFFSANTILVSGHIVPEEYEQIIELSRLINGDKLLKNHIIGVRKVNKNSFILVVDQGGYYLELGTLTDLQNKLDNYKVFYNKFILESADMPYKKLNLRFNNQIVATK